MRWLVFFAILCIGAVAAVPLSWRLRSDQCVPIFEKIQDGMTKEEVDAILGHEGNPVEGGPWLGSAKRFGWRWEENGDQIHVGVGFNDDGKSSNTWVKVLRKDGRESIVDDALTKRTSVRAKR